MAPDRKFETCKDKNADFCILGDNIPNEASGIPSQDFWMSDLDNQKFAANMADWLKKVLP
jgi:hypothetical protein